MRIMNWWYGNQNQDIYCYHIIYSILHEQLSIANSKYQEIAYDMYLDMCCLLRTVWLSQYISYHGKTVFAPLEARAISGVTHCYVIAIADGTVLSWVLIRFKVAGNTGWQGWGEYQIYEYEYLQYVWVRVRVWVLDYCMSPSPSTGWWVRVPAYDLHSI